MSYPHPFISITTVGTQHSKANEISVRVSGNARSLRHSVTLARRNRSGYLQSVNRPRDITEQNNPSNDWKAATVANRINRLVRQKTKPNIIGLSGFNFDTRLTIVSTYILNIYTSILVYLFIYAFFTILQTHSADPFVFGYIDTKNTDKKTD